MSAPSPFTTACELLEQIIASNNLPTTVHQLEVPADKRDTDPGYYVAPCPIKTRQAETALVVCLHEIRKRYPNMNAAADFARRALTSFRADSRSRARMTAGKRLHPRVLE